MPLEDVPRSRRTNAAAAVHSDHSPLAEERYQTVFARVPGSVAAPTASLHFTPELLRDIERNGVEIVRLSLNDGLGTFRPVIADMSKNTSCTPKPTRSRRGRVAIERRDETAAASLRPGRRSFGRSRATSNRTAASSAGDHTTNSLSRRAFAFQVVDAMITNFHLPRSTLLMLVSAFGGRERVLRRVRRRYRAAISLLLLRRRNVRFESTELRYVTFDVPGGPEVLQIAAPASRRRSR